MIMHEVNLVDVDVRQFKSLLYYYLQLHASAAEACYILRSRPQLNPGSHSGCNII